MLLWQGRTRRLGITHMSLLQLSHTLQYDRMVLIPGHKPPTMKKHLLLLYPQTIMKSLVETYEDKNTELFEYQVCNHAIDCQYFSGACPTNDTKSSTLPGERWEPSPCTNIRSQILDGIISSNITSLGVCHPCCRLGLDLHDLGCRLP